MRNNTTGVTTSAPYNVRCLYTGNS